MKKDLRSGPRVATRVPDLAYAAHCLGTSAAVLREASAVGPDLELRHLADEVTELLGRLNKYVKRKNP